MDQDELDSIFLNSFLKDYHQKQETNAQYVKESRLIAEQKQKKLQPVAEFLDKFTELGVKVFHRDTFDTSISSQDFEKSMSFTYYMATTSKAWEPGISIMIDHPAQIEIAIPNDEKMGLFVLNISTDHPDSLVLKQKFNSLSTLCQALAIFINKNTIAMDVNPQEVIKNLENKMRFDGTTIKDIEKKKLEAISQKRYSQTSQGNESATLSKIGEYFKKKKTDMDDNDKTSYDE